MWHRRLFSERGQALLEFALVLPLLLLLAWGLVDLGKLLSHKNQMSHLAGQAARYVATNSCAYCASTTINDWTNNTAAQGSLKGNLTVTVQFANSSGLFPGDPGYTLPVFGDLNHCVTNPNGAPAAKVTITYVDSFLTPLAGVSQLSSITLKSSAIERLEKNWGAMSGTKQPGDKYDVDPVTVSLDNCP